MDQINKDTKTLVDNEVTDIPNELATESAYPTDIDSHNLQRDEDKISHISGNQHGFASETSGYEIEYTQANHYHDANHWHPEVHMGYTSPGYTPYDQSSYPYHPNTMMSNPDNRYPPFNQHQQTEIGLQPTTKWSNREHSYSQMEMHASQIYTTDG